ncbi:MAG: ABC transporter permease [Anaerolineae bacterium]|nr:ABC transporter permease [Anaerolineae bacterium]
MNALRTNSRWTRARRWLSDMWILWVLIGLMVVMSFLSPVFLTAENLLENVARPASIVAIITIGMTFVITSRGLDLSVGSNAALSSTIGILAVEALHLPVPLGIVLSLIVGLSFGLVNAFFITKIRVAPFIVTLGMLSIGRGLTLAVSGTSFTYGLPDSYRDWGRGSILGLPTPFVILIVLWIVGVYLYSYTRIGLYARSLGSNESSTRRAGINGDAYKTLYYAFIGVLAALAGVLWSARANTISVTTGIGTELDVIAAVIIGGTSLFGGAGSVTGSILGAFALVVLTNGLQLFGINTLVQRIVIGVVIIVALAVGKVRSDRLTQQRGAEAARMASSVG